MFPKQRYTRDVDYGIGATQATVASLRMMNIPVPDQVTYAPASSYYVRGDGSRVGDGYVTVQWVWDVISIEKLSVLLSFLGGGQWANVYIRTDIRDGTYPNPRSAFNTYTAIMLKPMFAGQEGVPIARSPYAVQTLPITFKNLVEV